MPKQIKYTDKTPFPYGRYSGKEMQDVPAKYLMWMYDNNKLSQPIKEYVYENKDVLEIELNENN